MRSEVGRSPRRSNPCAGETLPKVRVTNDFLQWRRRSCARPPARCADWAFGRTRETEHDGACQTRSPIDTLFHVVELSGVAPPRTSCPHHSSEAAEEKAMLTCHAH